MEARKITIVSTKTQKKSVIMSGAETLGDLKKDLREAEIDYDGMTFYEGTSKTELKTDESVLPKDVPYTNRATGETKNTNELVFMLTNTNKKIRSGIMTRAEAYNTIKEMGLQNKCQEKLGKNFTMCKTSDLVSLIEDSKVKPDTCDTIDSCDTVNPVEVVDMQARATITVLVGALYEYGVIGCCVKDKVLDTLNVKAVTPTVSENYKPDSSSPYSDNEIDAMFSGVY